MKKIATLIVLIFLTASLSSCVGDKPNPRIVSMGITNDRIQRIAITNNRYAGRYTIIDDKTIKEFTKTVSEAKDSVVDSKLDPDFIFDFFDESRNVATFKYIAGLDDKDTANLMDSNGRLYRVSTSIEDEFMKRLMKKDSGKNIPEYYISLIKLLLGKINLKAGDRVVVDISRDYVVTRSLTSVQQKSILDSIDIGGVKIMFPSETNKWSELVKISTSKYTDETCNAIASITDRNNTTTKFEILGTFENGGWNYHIKYK